MQSGSKHKQRGATFLGMLTIVSILGLALYAGIRLVPLYIDYFSVVRSMNEVAKTLSGAQVTTASIRAALIARWQVDYISSATPDDIEVTQVPGGLEMRAIYEGRAPFISNIFFVVEFDKAVVIKTGDGM